MKRYNCKNQSIIENTAISANKEFAQQATIKK